MKKVLYISGILIFGCSLYCSAAQIAQQNDSQAREERDLQILSQKLVSMKKNMDKFVKDMTAVYKDDLISDNLGYGESVKVDIVDTDKTIIVVADLPGMDKDKIDIILEGGKYLRISGSRSVFKKEAGPGIVKQERVEGHFERVLELPAECESDGIKASYLSGVLEVVIPKKEPGKSEKIKIKVE